MKSVVIAAFLVCGGAAGALRVADAAERSLERSTLARLAALEPSRTLTIEGFPVGPDQMAPVRLQRVDLYSADARVYAETAAGRVELPRSHEIFLRGYSDDGSARVALALNPDLSVAHGSGSGADGSFVIHALNVRDGSTLRAVKLESDLPAGFDFNFRCGNEIENLDTSVPGGNASALGDVAEQLRTAVAAQTTAAHSLRFAAIAIDTDSLFMSRLFANDTTSATNWIAGMFNAMNLMYERDLLVQLQIGTTILRTNAATDPYTSFTAGATTAQLGIFTNYWKANESGVPRAFATLLSGAIASTGNSCSASGIAWLNQYCTNNNSYNLTQVCTNIAFDPHGSFDARIVGHEIGHNFGAAHTHCTNISTGVDPAATNTIDTCYSGESSCYSGATSCPAAGAGTIMSYCNMGGSGCKAGVQNQLRFHPTHITKIDGLIDTKGACFDKTDDVFFSSFE